MDALPIVVVRTLYTPTATRGHLLVDDTYWGFTLEDRLRPFGVKVPGETCIPAGTYGVKLEWSNHFKKILPRILGVTGFDGVLFHGGNRPSDTEGCILIGSQRKAFDWIFSSLSDRLVTALQAHDSMGIVTIYDGVNARNFLENEGAA